MVSTLGMPNSETIPISTAVIPVVSAVWSTSASEVLDTAAVDSYLQVREAFRQKRWDQIHDGNPPEPDFFDKELFED